MWNDWEGWRRGGAPARVAPLDERDGFAGVDHALRRRPGCVPPALPLKPAPTLPPPPLPPLPAEPAGDGCGTRRDAPAVVLPLAALGLPPHTMPPMPPMDGSMPLCPRFSCISTGGCTSIGDGCGRGPGLPGPIKPPPRQIRPPPPPPPPPSPAGLCRAPTAGFCGVAGRLSGGAIASARSAASRASSPRSRTSDGSAASPPSPSASASSAPSSEDACSRRAHTVAKAGRARGSCAGGGWRAGSASRALGFGLPSGFLRQAGVWSLRGWRALIVQQWAGLALPVFALLLTAFDQVACGVSQSCGIPHSWDKLRANELVMLFSLSPATRRVARYVRTWGLRRTVKRCGCRRWYCGFRNPAFAPHGVDFTH
eukprot:359416-Chlamydomonas_euryale.AAC.18